MPSQLIKKLRARVLIVLLPLGLNGCVVGDMDSSNYRFPPYVQTFQQRGQMGHTDPVQRRNDLHACGLDRKTNPDSELWRRNVLIGGETMEQHDKRIDQLETCMENKGYKIFDPGSCGPLKKPTGKCN